MKYFNVKIKDVLKEFQVDDSKGLSDIEVKKRIEKYGYNEFTKQEEGSIWEDILDSIKEPMMIILLVAAAISALIGEIHDAIGIVCAVSIGIAIGMVTEGKSKKAAEALSKMTDNIQVKVLRNEHIVQINKNEIVPGDIVFVETGDMVPADGRLIESIDLKVREDMLTGESEEVAKDAEAIVEMESLNVKGEMKIQDPSPAKQINMVFGGTLIAYGRGTFVVTVTGDSSEMGKIAQNLDKGDLETPLQIKLGDLGGKISKVSSIIALGLFLIMFTKLVMAKTLHIDTSGIIPFLNSIDPVKRAFIVCIALIVAAVPEGLPTMINITLAITMQKMAKINALVTKKEACETIGSVSVICSDKTGTLTQNRMSVEAVYIDGSYVNEDEAEHKSYFVENCLINSTAHLEVKDDEISYLGSATECALLLHHRDHDYMKNRNSAKILHQVPFNSKNKKMITVMHCNDNACTILIKGAPEVILKGCHYENIEDNTVRITDKRRNEILAEIEKLQKKSMRVLGFAYKTVMEEVAMTTEAGVMENGLVFTGFVGIKDPLRVDVKDAVETAAKAGVETKMLTGDNINTAISIGEELGLLNDEKRAVEATYIDTLSDEELREEIKSIAIVARSKPDTKMRIVQALQDNGEVIAVTGDGINDAPALSKADVGIAMGIAGTEVSKNSADIILTDDSFSTIVQGIKWGRGIYENFQRFIQFQITVNIVAFLIAILSVLFNFDMPFTTIQLLWVNIIMDGPPALSLGLETVREVVLKKKPVNRNASIITKSMITSMILNALYMTGIIVVQMSLNPLGASTKIVDGSSEMKTVLFALFAFGSLFNAFNCREFGTDSIIPNFTKNKIALQIITGTALVQLIITQVFSGFFNAVPLSFGMWIKVIAVSSLVIVINEIVKAILRKFTNSNKSVDDNEKVAA
ncbi:calcium-translocating P-type ATPase, PMCA-type [Clostridium lundense]|uniref:calcium-translocating P-type ATPase, PMCA-type n=1 Tax=Clostridium lundense TaxID=319475 RepID=UPI0004861EB6|nr:calcium-translocating P-type ATPase, PMCA-type [Clostridium lundense]